MTSCGGMSLFLKHYDCANEEGKMETKRQGMIRIG